MFIYDETCEQYGLDPKEVEKIARRLSRAAKDAQKMGLCVFGGSGSGSLRYMGDGGGGAQTVVADIDGSFDGGDGGDFF